MDESGAPSQGQAPAAAPPARFAIRCLAMMYEVLPLFALAFVATAPLVRFMPGDHVAAGAWWYRAYLVFALGLYFTVSWTRGGQTLAMRPWRLRLMGTGDRPVSWRQAWLRYFIAVLGWIPLGAGYWWMFFDPQRRTWHDRISGTRLIREPRT